MLSSFSQETNFSIYRINRNIDSDFNLVIWRTHRDCQINLRHYRSICTASMGFSPCSTEICQFKIPPTALFEQTAKYNVRQYFCLNGNYLVNQDCLSAVNHSKTFCSRIINVFSINIYVQFKGNEIISLYEEVKLCGIK